MGCAKAKEKETVNAVAVIAAEDEDDPRRSRDLRSGGGRTTKFVQVVSFVSRVTIISFLTARLLLFVMISSFPSLEGAVR
jgi:hypothetical protein